MWVSIRLAGNSLILLQAVVEEVVDVRGADQSIESLAAGGLMAVSPPEAVAILAFTMSQSSPELIYSNFIGTICSIVTKTSTSSQRY